MRGILAPLALLFVLAAPPQAALAQAPGLAEERAALERLKQDIEARVGALNAECSQVDSRDSARVADCSGRNSRLQRDMEDYARRLAAYRCRSADAASAKLKDDIAANQRAIRNIGLGTTTEAYERMEEMTKEQLHEFEAELLEATFSALVETGKTAVQAAASTGTAQGRHYVKYARDLGIDNPHVLEAIEAFSKAKGKPAKARALNEVVSRAKEGGLSAYHGYQAGAAHSAAEKAWHFAAIALVMTEESLPELAESLAKRFPSLAVNVGGKLTVTSGAMLAAPTVSFVGNMYQMGYSREAVEKLDIATSQQLEAVSRLHERMKSLVKQLKAQREIQAGCRR